MKDRINKLLDNYSLSSSQFAEKIGVQRSSISHIMSGRNKPSYDFIIKILDTFKDLNAEWLLTGRGEMIKVQEKNAPDSLNQTLFDTTPRDTAQNSDKHLVTEENIPYYGLENNKKHDIHNNLVNTESSEVTNVNSVKYMVIVYHDNSFEILNKK